MACMALVSVSGGSLGVALDYSWLGPACFYSSARQCRLCVKDETVEHVFIECWDAIFFWDVLQRTLKKDLPLTPHGIRFLPVDRGDVPYDMIMAVGLHAIWRSRMAVRHADPNALTVSRYFAQNVTMLYEVFKLQDPELEWLYVLEELCTFDVFFKSFRQPKLGRRFLI